MNKFMKILLLIVIITTMFMVFSINAYADSDELTIQINVYQGDTFIGATNMQAYPGEDLCLTSLNELYGDPQSANVTINGVAGIALTWSFPDYLTYATSSSGWAKIGDEVVINLYYPAVETDPEPEEIIYGTLILDLAVNKNDSPTNYSILLNGTKGVDTIEDTYAFPEDGILTLTNLDVSYAWEYTFNDSTFPANFDENNTCYNQLSVQTLPEPEPITEGNEHMVYVTWEYFPEPGAMVDLHMDNAFAMETTSFTAISGSIIDFTDIQQNPPGATYVGDNLIQIGNNFYRISGPGKMADNIEASGKDLANFIMVDDDVYITFPYIFDHSVETEIEKEVIVEKEVPVEVPVEVIKEVEKEVIVEKEVPVEVPVEIPVEVIKEVEKEVPVPVEIPVLTPVEIPVPVPIPVTIEKETIKEVPVVVEKEKETIKEVPVIVTQEKETIKEVPRIVTNTVERPIIVEKETTKIVEKPVVAETTNTTTTTNNTTTPTNTNGLEEIDDGAVPLAEFIPSFNEEPENVNTWSLVNLGLLILTFLLWFSYEPLGPGNIITGIAMLGNIILFMETQDITSKVVWIDKWTWIMAVIYTIGLGIKYYQYNKENKKT